MSVFREFGNSLFFKKIKEIKKNYFFFFNIKKNHIYQAFVYLLFIYLFIYILKKHSGRARTN